MLRIFFGLAFLSVLVSCDSNIVVSDSKPMAGVWDKAEIVEFTLLEMDSLKNYNLFLNIRNTNEYKYSNLFLIATIEFPQGKTITDTLEYKMANPDGTWLGHGIGSVKENKLWYKENVSFTEKGKYILRIGHAVRNNGNVEGVTELEGINDVGFSIEETPQQN